MALEELTEGSIVSKEQISQYGLVQSDLKVAGTLLYQKGRRRFFMEQVNGDYKIGLIYDLPELN